MGSLPRIRRRWDRAMLLLGADGQRSKSAFQEIATAYSEPNRHYHGVAHIAAMLDLSEAHRALVRDPLAVDLSILFHDAIYDPKRNDNEEASAQLAERWLPLLGAGADLTTRVAGYIRATAHGRLPSAATDTDLIVLLDVDLSILASPPAEYRDYADAISREYAHVSPDTYREGRAHILRRFLTRGQIYLTPQLHGLWEADARANLAAELALLDNSPNVAPGD